MEIIISVLLIIFICFFGYYRISQYKKDLKECRDIMKEKINKIEREDEVYYHDFVFESDLQTDLYMKALKKVYFINFLNDEKIRKDKDFEKFVERAEIVVPEIRNYIREI